MRLSNVVFLFFVNASLWCAARSEFLTFLGIGTALVAAYSSFCYFKECCNDVYIPHNYLDLKYKIKNDLYGQPLVQDVLHMLQRHNENSKKALAISLHGWPGVGKTYLVNMIIDSFYLLKGKSSFVKKYAGIQSFPSQDQIQQYRSKLRLEIMNTVIRCPKALFVFEEVNDIYPDILDVLKPMLDYQVYNGIDYSKAVFIFISNVGGDEITQKLLELNKPRDQLQLSDFDETIRDISYQVGGLKGAKLLDAHLIDHFIPFLPLEQHHVEQCIKEELGRWGVVEPDDNLMKSVMSVITFGPKSNPIYSNSGCKRINKQVDFAISKLLMDK